MESVLLRLSRKPPVSVPREATIIEAVRVMLAKGVGAAVVLSEGRAIGVFTERDVMSKIVAAGREASETRVGDVMTSPVLTVGAEASVADALQLMLSRHIRHIPVVDSDGVVLGMVSMRYLMRERIDRLQDEARSLENYIGAEGIAGG
jgi:CBS domain-containing protein